MNIRLALTLSCVLGLGSAACKDDKESPLEPTGDATVPQPDGGKPDGSTPPDGGTPDSGPPVGPPDAGPPTSLSLVDYVNDLVDHHTDATSTPDDVAARTIVDTQDSTAFDSRFK